MFDTFRLDDKNLPTCQCIYGLIFTLTRQFYVGQAIVFGKRISDHIADFRYQQHHNYLLQDLWNKHGPEAFQIKILEYISDGRLLTQIEQDYVDMLGSMYYDNGFNLIEPIGFKNGFLGKHHTEETKQKLRLVHLGKKLTPEHIAKSVASATGLKRSEEFKQAQKIRNLHVTKGFTLISPEGQLVSCIGILQTSQKLNIPINYISNLVNKRKLYHKGWRLYDPMQLEEVAPFVKPKRIWDDNTKKKISESNIKTKFLLKICHD